ncbi:MAG: hypothetical protein ACI8QZ_003447 [Chlamydiales bacterium]|jgi:hypothetical protein
MGSGRIFAGLDEAGLGPMLGPLTIGFSAVRVPHGCEGGSELWERLRDAVAAEPAYDKARLIVADSKVVFTRNPRGRARLERTALSFLELAQSSDGAPTKGTHLLHTLRGIPAPTSDVLGHHPWYERLPDALPVWTEPEALAERTEALRETLELQDVQLLAAGVRVVPAGELNASYQQTLSKGLTLWLKTADLMEWLWSAFPGEDITLVVDRHGGRTHYGRLLAQTFPFAEVETVVEANGRSQYRIRDRAAGERAMQVFFRERAEEHSFPVALGSCLAKYLREISMLAFNDYFGDLQPNLRPTAGYVTDARRWLADAGEAVRRADLAPEVLIRTR